MTNLAIKTDKRLSCEEIEEAVEPDRLELEDILEILEETPQDPTLKKCSSCLKKGRVFMHPLDHFSVLKSGKFHSQCKVCRTENSVKWCREQGKRRKDYQKTYQEEYRKRSAESKSTRVRLSKPKQGIAAVAYDVRKIDE